MSSDDPKNSKSKPRRPSQRLELKGDATGIPDAGRMSTVLVNADDPTPPPSNTSGEFLSADEPTPPPSSLANASGEFLSADAPTPPPSSIPEPSPVDDDTLPPGAFPPSSGSASNPDTSSSTPAYTAEHITSTGFIPSEHFKAHAERQQQADINKSTLARSIDIGKLSIPVPRLSFLDNADTKERILYGGGGLIGGALLGGLMGILNTFLQGWSVADGTTQIFGLAIIAGLIGATVAALKPSRVDALFNKMGISDD